MLCFCFAFKLVRQACYPSLHYLHGTERLYRFRCSFRSIPSSLFDQRQHHLFCKLTLVIPNCYFATTKRIENIETLNPSDLNLVIKLFRKGNSLQRALFNTSQLPVVSTNLRERRRLCEWMF